MKKLFAILLIVIMSMDVAVGSDNQRDIQARKLVENVLNRYVGKTEVSMMSMMTCAYSTNKKKAGCKSKPRKKVVQSVSKNYGASLKDSRGLLLILEPISEYGIGILQYDYDKKGKDADQWLYLPELDQVKRVASSGDAPKKGSLFGSEFSLEDVEKQKIEDYFYKYIEETTFNKRPVMIVEHHPTEKRALKSNYLKRVQWIDSERFVVLKEEFYAWNGQLFKTSYATKIEQINGIWTARKQLMTNIKTKRISVISINDIAYNLEISDEALTTRILNDVVFREAQLKSLREEKKKLTTQVGYVN